MKIKIYYLFFILAFLFNFLSCNDKGVDDGDYTAISYISHQNSGCLSNSAALSKENEVTFDLRRKGFYIDIILSFTTLCEASFKDSVSISSNKISICLVNENAGALCICPYRDEFNFRLIKGGVFNISFYLKNSVESEYQLAADTTITI